MFYNEDCTEEELQELGKKSLQLFDEELRENNEEESYLIRLQGEVQNYKNNKRKITSVSLASSTNVDYYTADGYSFARISCGYTMTENGKKVLPSWYICYAEMTIADGRSMVGKRRTS